MTAQIIILFIIGIVLIVKGGDLFVDASVWIAEVSGIPKFIIGATIVSFATTLPELLVSVFAAIDGKSDMAVGNAVGSVTANIGLIMAVSILFIPVCIKRREFIFKPLLMIASIVLLILFSLGESLSLAGSLVIISLFAVFIVENIRSAKRTVGTEAEKKQISSKKEVVFGAAKFILGTVGIVVGARLLVDNGSEIARAVGISEAVISVTVIAVGTSLPELVTTITAIVKKQPNLSVGNIIGANIFDLTLIMPICSIIKGGSLSVSKQGLMLDMPACLAVAVIAVIPAIISGKFRRLQGGVLLAAYVAYLTVMIVYFV
ncbi:MAG: calcium/sodium antiporter [Clostridia bacterium]|nr:calcium/sodium antiporter [Clostridia bacterium]